MLHGSCCLTVAFYSLSWFTKTGPSVWQRTLAWSKLTLATSCFDVPLLLAKALMPDRQHTAFSIQVFFPTGDPNGVRIVGMPGWIGMGVAFNRTNFKEALANGDADMPGVYVLIGTSGDGVLPTIYVGEGTVKDRLSQHHAKKDFWDWAVFFVSKDNSLHKAHVQHLEARLAQLAKVAKQCKLDAGKEPKLPKLANAEIAFVDSFLQNILCIFPLLGLGVFEKTETSKKPTELLTLTIKPQGAKVAVNASGYRAPKGLVVCKGSQAVKKELGAIPRYVVGLRADLKSQGVIVDEGDHYTFTQDQVFTSSSTAASVIIGGAAAGPALWKNKDGKSLKELQQAESAASDDHG